MTTPAIGHARCGCDCKNQTEFAVCDGRELNVCCEHAPDGAPSAYGLLWECANLDLFHGKIGEVWRDCQTECKWSTRDGFFFDHTVLPCDPTGVPTANWRYFPPLHIDNTQPDGQQATYAALPFKCCASVPNATLYGAGDRDGYRDWFGVAACDVFPEKSAEVSASNVIWELEITSPTTATLTYFGGVVVGAAHAEPVVYNCENFTALGRNTFIRDDATFQWVLDHYLDADSPFVQLTKAVCAVALVGNYRTPCETAQDACACADSGCSSACLTTGGSCGLPEKIDLERNATLPACITAPTPAPCGYFYGEAAASGGTLGFLLWCDGGLPWKLRVYCFNSDPCELVCETDTVEVRTCPDGYEFTWACASFGDCCTVTQCSCNLPTTLFATVDSTNATLDGDVITLTWDGTDSWDGTWSPGGGCPTLDVEFQIQSAGADCIAELVATGPDGQCLFIQSQTFLPSAANCEDILLDDPGTWNGGGTANCCAPSGSGITINVTP